MPNLLSHLLPAYNWLKAIDPSLPRALFVALVFLTVMAWRKLLPESWIKFSNLVPVSDEDTSWFKATVRKAWQALPSALLGAVYGALGTGGDVLASLKLAALALLAPVIHDVAAHYQGNLGTKKNPPPLSIPDGPLLVLLLVCSLPGLHGCARLAKVDWTKVEACVAQPAESALIQIVSGVLAGTGDVKTELEGVAEEYGTGAVKCVVVQIVDDTGLRPHLDKDARQHARGKAFLDSVAK